MLESSDSRVRTACIILVLSTVLIPYLSSSTHASGPSQPSIFYLHRQASKTINTVTTNLWSNTSQLWSGTPQTEARNAVKGAPAVWDFYSQPVMAGAANFTGPVTFTLFLVSTGNTGTGTVITGTVSKVTSTGTVIPLAVASLTNAPITTSISVYSLTIVSLVYQMEAGANFDFTITVNIPGRSVQTITLYYDTPAYKSQVSVTFQARLGISSFSSYDRTGTPTRFFSRNSTAPGRQVTLRTTIFDAVGLYDVGLVNTTVVSPAGSAYLSSTPLTLIQGMAPNYTGIWSLNFTHSSGDPSGSYISSLSAVDNSGVSVNQQLSYTLYAVWLVSFRTVSSDTTPTPISLAFVTVYSSGTPVFTGTSNSSGWVAPGSVLLRDNATYYIQSYWEGVLVNQTNPFTLKSSTTLSLSLSAYTIDFSKAFRDGSGILLTQPPSSFQLASQSNGSITTPNPSASYLLPAGTYTISLVTWKGVDVTPSGGFSFNPRTGTPSINLQIYALTLLVVDQNGGAIANAQVTLLRNSQTVAQGTTGNDGSLILPGLPGGQYIIQVNAKSQTTSATISLNQNSSERIQVIPPAPPTAPGSWLTQSWAWFLLVGAAIGGFVGYRQVSRSRLAFKEEPFDYLNKLTGGGFADGDTVLIIGDQSTAKTTLCEQLAYQSMVGGNPTVFLTYEGAERVRESMKRFKWDPMEYESKNQFQLIECETAASTDLGIGMVENWYGITALNISINTALAQLRTTRPRVFIDSLTPLAETSSITGIVNLVLDTSAKMKKLQGQLFVTIGRSISKTVLSKLEDAADGVLELTQLIDAGKPVIDLRVKKMRGRKYDSSPVRVRVDNRKGIAFQVRRSLQPKKERPVAEKSTAPRSTAHGTARI